MERVFATYQKRHFWRAAGGLVGLVGVTLLAGLLCGGLGGVVAAVAAGALLINRLLLTGNRWLRAAMTDKLRQLGEVAPPGRTRFVGLAHPEYLHDAHRRRRESDDDVGFLTLSRRGLCYQGDADAFEIPYEAIAAVSLTRSSYAPWPRILIRFEAGEPYDAVIVDSRNDGTFGDCQRDSRQLYREITAILARLERHGGQRMIVGPAASEATQSSLTA